MAGAGRSAGGAARGEPGFALRPLGCCRSGAVPRPVHSSDVVRRATDGETAGHTKRDHRRGHVKPKSPYACHYVLIFYFLTGRQEPKTHRSQFTEQRAPGRLSTPNEQTHTPYSLQYRSRCFMISTPCSTLRSQAGFATGPPPWHTPASASRASSSLHIGGSGRTRPGLERFWFCSAPAFPMAPSFRRPLSSRRGEALWEREAAGSGLPGAVSSESAAGFGTSVGSAGSVWLRPRFLLD